jgi:hypothetical protein
VFSRVWERACAVAAGAGADWYWARHLPAGLVAAGAAGVASATESWTFAGGTPWAQLHAMTIEQLAPVLVADGLEAELLSDFNAELSDPGRWFPSVAAIAAWGHRPR